MAGVGSHGVWLWDPHDPLAGVAGLQRHDYNCWLCCKLPTVFVAAWYHWKPYEPVPLYPRPPTLHRTAWGKGL